MKTRYLSPLVCAALSLQIHIALRTASGATSEAALAAPEFTLEAYVAELDHWAEAVERLKQHPGEVSALRKRFPTSWHVSAGGQQYTVSTEWLRRDLESFEKSSKSGAPVDAAVERLHAMRATAVELSSPAGYSPSEARQKLDAILKRPEFRTVHGPTWLDELRERVIIWLWQLFEKLFGAAGSPVGVGRILAWVMVSAASLILIVWMVRRLMRRPHSLALNPEVSQQAMKNWQQRAREAFAAAERGDYRDAVRLAYWAGVYRLEELGLWKTERTRTHREYLHLLPSAHPQRDTFSEITRHFERTWYAGEPSSAEEFSSVIRNLERLGCEFRLKLATERS